jgi:hypothetical protein
MWRGLPPFPRLSHPPNHLHPRTQALGCPLPCRAHRILLHSSTISSADQLSSAMEQRDAGLQARCSRCAAAAVWHPHRWSGPTKWVRALQPAVPLPSGLQPATAVCFPVLREQAERPGFHRACAAGCRPAATVRACLLAERALALEHGIWSSCHKQRQRPPLPARCD